jgi:hypothetical protein
MWILVCFCNARNVFLLLYFLCSLLQVHSRTVPCAIDCIFKSGTGLPTIRGKTDLSF